MHACEVCGAAFGRGDVEDFAGFVEGEAGGGEGVGGGGVVLEVGCVFLGWSVLAEEGTR